MTDKMTRATAFGVKCARDCIRACWPDPTGDDSPFAPMDGDWDAFYDLLGGRDETTDEEDAAFRDAYVATMEEQLKIDLQQQKEDETP